MSFFRTALFLCPATLVLAQTPPQTARPATPVPPQIVQAAPSGPTKVNPDGSVTMPMRIPPAPAQVPPDQVILTVGDLTLTAKQYDEICDGLQDQYKTFFKGPGRKQFADQLVRIFVMAQEGKRRGIDQTPSFQAQVKFQADQVLANDAAQKMMAETKVDDAALHKYYDEHKSEYEQIRARHILIRFQGSQVPVKPGGKDLSDAEALAKAQEIEKKLKEGGDFAALATAESDDTGSAALGGDLGVFGHGRMVKSFEDTAFKMKPGELSEPVKSQFGYHIIRVDSIENKSFDDVKADIEKKLKPQLATQAMEQLQKNTKVVFDPVFFSLEKK